MLAGGSVRIRGAVDTASCSWSCRACADDWPALGDQGLEGEQPAGQLQTFQDTLQADAYAGFGKRYDAGRVILAVSWAHVRRKFYENAQAHDSSLAQEALRRIGALYAIEAEIRGQSPGLRQARVGLLPAALHPWLQEHPRQVSPSQRRPVRSATRSSYGGADPLSGRRANRDRQQSRRAGTARGRLGGKGLSLRRLR